MKLKKLMLVASIFLFTASYAQDLKIHVNKKGKVGFVDSSGREVIKCQYESAQPFSNGIAIVTKSGKKGIINESGKVILPLKYAQITPWGEGLFLINAGKTRGLANGDGKIVLPTKYTMISKPNCYGRAIVAAGGKAKPNDKRTYMYNAKFGIIDSFGEVLIAPKYKGLYEFSWNPNKSYPYYEGKRLEFSYHYIGDTLVTDCEYVGFSNSPLNIYKAGIMDGRGKILMKTGLYDYVMEPQSDMARYYISKKKETLCGYHNLSTGRGFQVAKTSTPMKDIKFWTHGDFSGDIAPVNGSEWIFIDKNGQTVRSGYKSLSHCGDLGLWGAMKPDSIWEVFDESNRGVEKLSGYNDIKFPKNKGDKEVFVVKKNGRYGVINRNGESVVPFEYDRAMQNSFDYIPVHKNGKWGLVTPSNTVVIPAEYKNLVLPSAKNTQDFWVEKDDALHYHFNARTNKLSTQGYKQVRNFKDGLAFVVPESLKVTDSPVTRAQTCQPNSPNSTIDSADMSKWKDAFGYIVDADDAVVIDQPVSHLYIDAVKKKIAEYGGKKLTRSDVKSILLDVTRSNRSYDLKTVIDEDEWNY